MNSLSIKRKTNLLLGITGAINFILIVLVGLPILYEIKVHQGYLLYIYIVFYLILPGKLFARLLNFDQLDKDRSFLLLLYFYFGCAILFVEYYILLYLHMMHVIKYLNFAISIAEVFCIIRKNVKNHKMDLQFNIFSINLTVVIIMVLISFAISMLINNYKVPYVSSTMHPDRTYQISNLVGLTTNEPFQSMTIYGRVFKYHYFNNLLGSIVKIIFNIPGYYFVNYFTPLYIPFLLTVSFFALYRMFVNDRIIMLLLFIICYFNLLSDKYCYYSLHVSSNINAMGLAIPCFILTVLVANYVLKLEHSDRVMQLKHCIILSALTFVLTGIKGPAGIVFAVSYLTYIVFYKVPKKFLIYSFIVIITFLITYYSIVRGDSSPLSTQRLPSNFTFPSSIYRVDNKMIANIYKCFFILPSIVLHYNLFILPVLVMIPVSINSIFRKKGFIYFVVILAWCSIVSGFLFRFPGNSELYFLMLSFPLVSLIMALFCSRYQNRIHVIVFLMFMVAIYLPGNIERMYSATNSNFNDSSFASFSDVKNYYLHSVEADNPVFAGYRFIKDNTENNSLIATNKLIYEDYKDDYRSHNLAAFGERHVYLEGYQYAGINGGYKGLDNNIKNNEIIFSNVSDDEKYSLLKELGIDYVFLYKKYVGNFIQSKNFIRVFDNDEVSIFKIA